MTAVKLNARTLIDRTEHVGMGAEARNARRGARWGQNAQWFTEEARHEHARAREADHGADGAGHTYWLLLELLRWCRRSLSVQTA